MKLFKWVTKVSQDRMPRAKTIRTRVKVRVGVSFRVRVQCQALGLWLVISMGAV